MKVSGIAYVEWTLSLDFSELKSQCRTSVYTSITKYPTALLQERDVNFEGVNSRQWWGYPSSRKILPYSPIAGTIARVDCIKG